MQGTRPADHKAPEEAPEPARWPVRGTLYALFAASGFAGLIYESIWTHYLKLFLGHAAYAQTLVLAIFMGGMALGSWISSRWSPRWRSPLRAYAAAEAAISVLALGFHELFTATMGFAYDGVLPRLAGSPAGVTALKWGLSSALILPQSVLLGMTFPLMTAGVLRAFADRPGRSVAMLYFTNSLGAAAGVLVSGFVLVGALGLPGTIRLAGIINLAVAAAVFWLSRRRAAPVLSAAGDEKRRDAALLLFLTAALVTGTSSFIYEVAWIRMLSLVLGSSTHSFELMLSAFILGLALGGLWIQRRIDRLRSPVRTLACLQLAMGVLAVATMLAYGETFEAMRWLVLHLKRTNLGYALFNLASNGLALAIMLPATFCAGTTLPLITFHLLQRGHGERSIGAVYAANTLGAIAGIFFAIHVGLPFLGLKKLLTLGGALDVALGAVLLFTAAAGFAGRRVPLALAAAGALSVALLGTVVHLDPRKMASGIYRNGIALFDQQQVEYHRDGKTATVSLVSESATGALGIRTNGKTDAEMTMAFDAPPTGDEPTMILLGAMGMALHPQARSVACIGFGSGLTTHTLLGNPSLSHVDTVEIEPEMVRAAGHFRPRNELAFSDPRSRIVIDDAKTFFSTRGERYDLIVSEPSNPWVSGVSGLFSQEFYRLMRRHLAPSGVFVQWIQLYEIDVPLVASVLKALETSFGDYVVYAMTGFDLLIAARGEGSFAAPDASVLMPLAVARELERVEVRSLQDLELRRVGTRSSWEGLTSAIPMPANSDYYPVLDQNAVRARFFGSDASVLTRFEKRPFPVVEMLSEIGRPGTVTSVTPSPRLFPDTERAVEAMRLRDLLLKRIPFTDEVVQSPELREHARAASRWLDDCKEEVPLTSLLRVGQAMVPELTTADLEAVWRTIFSSECARKLSVQDREWLQVLQAIGRRDFWGMASGARHLLAVEPDLAVSSKRYLIAAGMLGSIGLGDPVGARNLWSHHRGSMPPPDDLLLQVLVARSNPAK